MKITISGKTVLVDKEEWSKICNLPWHIETNHGYAVYRDRQKHKFYMHRLIMHNPPNKIIDHINRNKLDNRKINLRLSSSRRNVLNQGNARGISRMRDGRWRAYATITGKQSKRQIHLGYYQSQNEAEIASRVARIVLERVYSSFDL